MNIENYLFDTKWNKLAKPLEKYLLELAKKNPIYKNFNVNLPGVSILGVHETILISKNFGFIEWLVDNDKIDRTYRKDLKYPYYIDDKERDLKGYGKSDLLLMLCSIQDNPIEFLCEILK